MYKAFFISLFLLIGYGFSFSSPSSDAVDCDAVLSMLESAAEEAESTDDTVKEVFALSSLCACYAADLMVLIRHSSEDAYKAIMRLFCKMLIMKSVVACGRDEG